MSTQHTFNFEPGRARSSDPETSRAAAMSINANALEQIVYSHLLSVLPDGRTTKELAEETGLDRVTISPRMKPLESKGMVRRGEKRDKSEVWRAIPKG